MTAEESLTQFLSKAMRKRWQARYISLSQSKRGKKTIIEDLWHQFEERLDPDKSVTALPENVWALPAFSYSQRNGFGREEESMKNAFETAGDGSLIIDRTGTYGIHQPEDMGDGIKFLKV